MPPLCNKYQTKEVILISLLLATLLTDPFVDVIKHYEGFYAQPYTCPAGKWTVGYGHLCSPTHSAVTKTQANILLATDLTIAFNGVMRHAGEVLNNEPQHRTVALMSWVFNLGVGNLQSSTMLKRIKEKDWEAAAKEMLRWDKCTNPRTGKKRSLVGLSKRRNAEAHYFLTGKITLF